MERTAGHPALLLTVILLLAGCAAAEPAIDPEAEEQAITELVGAWNDALDARDVETIVSLYAPNGYLAPPNTERAVGRAAVRGWWGGVLAMPGVEGEITTLAVDIADAGDMALESGDYRLAFDTDDGRVEDRGKYVVVWRKVNGQWRVAADMFNSNLPE